jgi:hypothetical protein
MAQRDNFQHKCDAGLEFPSGDAECFSYRPPMKAGYPPQAIETPNESRRIMF